MTLLIIQRLWPCVRMFPWICVIISTQRITFAKHSPIDATKQSTVRIPAVNRPQHPTRIFKVFKKLILECTNQASTLHIMLVLCFLLCHFRKRAVKLLGPPHEGLKHVTQKLPFFLDDQQAFLWLYGLFYPCSKRFKGIWLQNILQMLPLGNRKALVTKYAAPECKALKCDWPVAALPFLPSMLIFAYSHSVTLGNTSRTPDLFQARFTGCY